MTSWIPRSKYEVAPGLFIGSEIGDIDRAKQPLMKKWCETGDSRAFSEYMALQRRREELLMPKKFRTVCNLKKKPKL